MDKYNETILNLIKKIYYIFINKKIEIEKNKNIINFSTINDKELENKVDELQKKFYSFSPINEKKSSLDYIIKEILSIEQDIKKSEKKIKNEKELDKNKQEIIPVIADKFLIIDDKSEKVDINKIGLKPINLSEINKKTNTIDEIEIDDIIKPNSYSINSLMEYYGSCILKTQMLPAFIRNAVINKNIDQITKANNILSTLFNLYNISDGHNFSLISPRIEEFRKSFELMFSKLKNSGVNFSKQDIENIKNNNEKNEIKDFIILPEKDNFTIRTSNFHEDNLIINPIIFLRDDIQSIQDSQVMNLQYENADDKRVEITNRVIEKVKNINRKKLKLDEITERDEKLDKLYSSYKLKEIVEIKKDSNIYKLLESSEFLSNRIFQIFQN